MARRLVLVTAAVALFASVTAAGASAACTKPLKSTSYEPPSSNSAFPVDDSQWVAQSFKISSAGRLSKVSIDLEQADGGSDSITVQIRPDAGDSPGATILGTRTRTLPSTSPEFADFDFSADNIQLAAGTTYWIVAINDQSSLTGYQWQSSSSAGYADGNLAVSPNHGTNWGSQTYDALFQVWTQTCTADVQPIVPGPPTLAAVSGLAFTNKTLAAESSGPSATTGRKKAAPKGTRVSYTLNEAATVVFTVKRRATGRRVKRGKRKVCVKPTRKNRKKHRCARYVGVRGSFTLNGAAGNNSFHFTGRMNGRKLTPGRYRLLATPSAGGKAGTPVSTAFRIVR